MIAIDLSKQQALDADPRAIQQIDFKQIQIEVEIRDFISFMKKEKELFWTFPKVKEKFYECN